MMTIIIIIIIIIIIKITIIRITSCNSDGDGNDNIKDDNDDNEIHYNIQLRCVRNVSRLGYNQSVVKSVLVDENKKSAL
jgi:hypothetical protein